MITIQVYFIALPYASAVARDRLCRYNKYYTERLLPVYINIVQKARLRDSKARILQEDNDPSHGNGPRSLYRLLAKLKDDN